MLDKKTDDTPVRQPSGFTSHSGGLASEHAREQGWGIKEEVRARDAQEKQDSGGVTDHSYEAKHFSDSAEDTSAAQPTANTARRIISIPIKSVPLKYSFTSSKPRR